MGGLAWLAYYFQVRDSFMCVQMVHASRDHGYFTFILRQVFYFDGIYAQPYISDMFYPEPPDLSGPSYYLSAARQRQRWAQV